MPFAAQWAAECKVVPHIGRTINGTADDICAGLPDMAAGTAPPRKTVVALL